MKKLLLYLLCSLVLVLPVSAYVVKSGDTPYGLWGVNWKTELAKFGISDPKKLPVGLETEEKMGVGYTPVTGYSSRLSQYVSPTATSIPVVSTKDPAGNEIDLSKISSGGTVKVYMNIDAGTPNQEPIMCTGKSVNVWSSCIRGLDFQGSSEVASTTLQKAHNAGTPIIITNIGQFYNQFVDIDGNQTINGIKSFANTSSIIFNVTPFVSSSADTYLGDDYLATQKYVNDVGAGGFTASNVSTTRGLSVDGSSPEKIGINASSTTGGAFDASGKYYQAIGNALEYKGNAIAVSTSTIVSQIATSTPTASMIPLANASGTISNIWVKEMIKIGATTTEHTANSTSTVTYLSENVTGGYLNSSNVIKIEAFIKELSFANNNPTTVSIFVKYGGVNICTTTISNTSGSNRENFSGKYEVFIYASSTVAIRTEALLETTQRDGLYDAAGAGYGVRQLSAYNTTIDTTSDKTLTLTAVFNNDATAINDLTIRNVSAYLIR